MAHVLHPCCHHRCATPGSVGERLHKGAAEKQARLEKKAAVLANTDIQVRPLSCHPLFTCCVVWALHGSLARMVTTISNCTDRLICAKYDNCCHMVPT